jgi:hypothetical protein
MPWKSDEVPVLNRLRDVSLETVQWKPNEQEQAAIDKVWSFVGVEIGEYGSSENPWTGVERGRREGVRQRFAAAVRDDFIDAAFLRGGRAARDAFTREHLKDWGDRLLAADAAAHAAGPTVTDDDSTGLDTAVSVVLANLPEETRLIVEGIMEEAAAKGYEISDCDELLRYARNRYVEAAAEFGAVDSVLAPALPQDAAQPGPFDDDLSELYENVSRSRSGRDGASVISDFSLSSRLSGLSFVSQREALRRLHRDMLENRISVDTIPGLKKTRSKLQKAVRKVRKAGTKIRKATRRGAENFQSFFTSKK